MVVRWAVPVAFAVAFLTGCAEPELSRRFAQDSTNRKGVPAPSVTLTAFTMESPPASPQPLLLRLSDRGQSALIEAVAKEPAQANQIVAALTGKKPIGLDRDFTLFDRRLVFNIDPTNFRPADRLAEARITVELSSNAKFVSWDRFANAYGDVDLGTISLTQGNSFNAELSAALPTLGPLESIGATLAGGATRTLIETTPLKRHFVQISGSLTERKAHLTQRGDVGIDLSGTAIADLAIRLNELDEKENFIFAFSELEKNDGSAVSPGEVRVIVETVRRATSACPVSAKLQLTATIREVVSGADTIIEGDDQVRFTNVESDLGTTLIIDSREIRTALWILEVPESGDTLGVRTDLQPNRPGSWATVILGTQGEAEQFKAWLTDLRSPPPRRLRNTDLGLIVGARQRPLNSRDVDQLQVRPFDELELSQGATRCP